MDAELQPSISRAMIETRLATLRGDQEQLLANLQAVHGAIQDCEYWLTVLAQSEKVGVKSDAK